MLYLLGGFILGAAVASTLLYIKFKSQIIEKDSELKILKSQNEQTQQNLSIMSEKFELLAGRIFDEKSSRFQDQNFKMLSTVLEPFKERLKDFEKKVEDSYSVERSERGSLKGELSKLIELNLKMSNEAESLTKALRGDNRTQGAWGELILESLLERSGLRKGTEYDVQGLESILRNEDGTTIRPDVIIHLPEGKHIVIDSKVSLTAYDQYINAQNTDINNSELDRLAKVHTDSVRKHVESLASKKYHTADKLMTPDFVILFMPLEPAFALAMRIRPELQQEAWDKQIAIVSPTTLLVTLKMVAALWKTERQEQNALEIAEKGGLLYDKFFGLVQDLELVGKKIEETQKAHESAMSKIKDGRGNLLRQVDQLRELGVKTNKRLQIEN